jgi:signal transduction histidine kinase
VNRLWVRLSLAFSGVILIWVLLVTMVPPMIIHWSMNPDPRSSRIYVRLEDDLTDFYSVHHSWDGVQPFLQGAQAALAPHQAGLVLADAQGRVLYGAKPDPNSQTLSPTEQDKALTLQTGGHTIGYLAVRPGDDPPTPGSERFLLEQLSRFLLLAAVVGGPSAILAGILMSRNLTAPLNQLAEAARDIGAHKFGCRLEPAGTTEMTEVAVAFNEMVDGLQRGETLRRNMMADVAHELRTPLSVLQGSLQAILDDVYPLSKEEITRLYDQTRHLGHLVNDLHQLAQAEAGQLPLNRQRTDLAALAREVAAAFEPVAEAEGVTLKVNVAAGLAPVCADSARLTQVLYNLMSNALRHTPAGGEIVLHGGQDPVRQPGRHPVRQATGPGGPTLPESLRKNAVPYVWLAVQDSGDGISAEHLPHVFERFYRADPARGRDTGGAGLGLAVARAIVEEHGGQITACSDGIPGKGSTFTIRLPIQA